MTVDKWQLTDDSIKNDVSIKWRFDQVTDDVLIDKQSFNQLTVNKWRFDQMTNDLLIDV